MLGNFSERNTMSIEKQPVTIKKYANRRLYNTGTSAYVTLEDLAVMVKNGDDFLVYDAKSNEDITRSVLTQIIFEQEAKDGQSLLPVTFLRQLIRFYGDSMQMLVPSYLEFSMDRLTSEQQKFREQMSKSFIVPAFGVPGLPVPGLGNEGFKSMDDMARRNLTMFSQALNMFNPFSAIAKAGEAATQSVKPQAQSADELAQLKTQMAEMQKMLEKLGK